MAELVAALLRAGFTETYRDERPDAFGSVTRIYERPPVRIRVLWDGRERTWLPALNATPWPNDTWGEIWITLPPEIKQPPQ